MTYSVEIRGGTGIGPGATYVLVEDDKGRCYRKWELYRATPRALRKAVKEATKYKVALERA